MDEKTDKKKEFVNRTGQGRYFSQGSLRRISVPVELDAQTGWQDKQNLRIELQEVEGKKILIVSEL